MRCWSTSQRGTDFELPALLLALAGRELRGKILLLRTGHMEEAIGEQPLESRNRPGLSLEAAHWLAQESGVSMVAIDSGGVESRKTANYELRSERCVVPGGNSDSGGIGESTEPGTRTLVAGGFSPETVGRGGDSLSRHRQGLLPESVASKPAYGSCAGPPRPASPRVGSPADVGPAS